MMEENLLTILARRWGSHTKNPPIDQVRDYVPKSGRTYSVGIVVAYNGLDSQGITQCENLVHLLTKSSNNKISQIILNSSAKPNLGFFKRKLDTLYQLIDLIKSVEIIHLIVGNYRDFWLKVLPVAIIGRFFGKHVVVEAIGSWTAKVSRVSLGFLKLWTGICQMILVSTGPTKRWSNALGVEVEESILMVNIEPVTRKKLTSVQPSIIADCRALPAAAIDEIITGCTIVKSKYPRTELLILIDDKTMMADKIKNRKLMESGFTLKNIDKDFRLENVLDSVDIFISCQDDAFVDNNMLMAAAAGSLIFTGKSSGLTKYLKETCQFEPITFSSRSDLAGNIIELIEKPDNIESLSKQARALAERFAWDNLGHLWLDRYERVL